MDFETRNQLWRKRDELKRRIDGIFAIIQNPVIPTDEDYKIADELIIEFEKCFKNTIIKIGEYLKSDECIEEVKFYSSNVIFTSEE